MAILGYGIKEWALKKDGYNCRCGDLEIGRHILVDCLLLDLQRQGLEWASPARYIPRFNSLLLRLF